MEYNLNPEEGQAAGEGNPHASRLFDNIRTPR